MSEILTFEYNLAELPSSQHRAGLAGLVLMVDWLKGEFEKDEIDSEKVICRRIDLNETKAVFEINQVGYKYLFDKVFGYFRKSEDKEKKPEGKTAKFIEKIVDDKTIYTQFILRPQGAFLADYDPTNQRNDGIWIELWRDMFFEVIRPDYNPKSHFNNREDGKENTDETALWKNLQKPPKNGANLKHSLFLTTVDKSPEEVPFTDQPRFQFLLYFWVFIAQIYVPMTKKYDKGKKKYKYPEFIGYALTIPDISNLKVFCAKFPKILKGRGDEMFINRYPKECVVDVAAEGALDFMHKFNERISEEILEFNVKRILVGVDVFHLKKKKNGVDVIGISRVNPRVDTQKYITIRETYRSEIFRRQRMLNYLNEDNWFYGFDSLLSKTDSEQTIGQWFFQNDVRRAFEDIGVINKSKGEKNMDTQSTETVPKKLEQVIYELVSTYVREKVRNKYQSEWSKSVNDVERKKHNELRGKVAREAFLAIRSRTDDDFIEYFASSICSYHQFSLKGEGFNLVAQALYDKEKRNQVRTLTMLALSANGYSPKSEKQGEENQ